MTSPPHEASLRHFRDLRDRTHGQATTREAEEALFGRQGPDADPARNHASVKPRARPPAESRTAAATAVATSGWNTLGTM